MGHSLPVLLELRRTFRVTETILALEAWPGKEINPLLPGRCVDRPGRLVFTTRYRGNSDRSGLHLSCNAQRAVPWFPGSKLLFAIAADPVSLSQ